MMKSMTDYINCDDAKAASAALVCVLSCREIDENTKKVAKALLDDPHVNEALEIVEESAANIMPE